MASASSDDQDERKKSNNHNSRSAFLGKTGTDESPLDRTYYNVLNVSPTASSAEIKRAYYALSLQYHPDRTQTLDDFTRREYAERFKIISQAYSILSDPEKRSLYNRYGKDERVTGNGAGGISLEEFNPEEFFRLMFGGDEFQDIIGDFELAKSFKQAINDLLIDAEKKDGELSHDEQETKARQRQANIEERRRAREQRLIQLSTNLCCKLDIFTESCQGSRHDASYQQALEQFGEIIRTETLDLLRAPYGEHLLNSIGYIYSSKAQLWSTKMDSQEGPFGKRLIGYGKHIRSSYRDRVHVVKETFKTVKSAVQWGQSMSKLAQATNDETPDSADSQMPFQHHSGRLEYSGYQPSESSEPPKSATPSPNSSAARQKTNRKSSAQVPVPLTDDEKRQLEADTAAKSMQALWRAVKLEIESVERDVCDRVLSDPSCPREILRLRCAALSKIGELWQEARDNFN